MSEHKLSPPTVTLLLAVLSLSLFGIDILTSWDMVGGSLYLSVLILAFWAASTRTIILFSCLISLFALLGAHGAPMHLDLSSLTDRFLTLSLVWVMTLVGLQYRRTHQIKSYLAAIVDSSDDAIIGQDLQGTITSWNRGAEQIYGYSAPEAVGGDVSMLCEDYRLHEIPELMQMLRWGKRINYYEMVHSRKDGSSVDVSLTISPIKTVAGQLIGISTIARDVTELKRAHDALKNERDRIQQYMDIAEVLMLVLGPEGDVRMINRKGLKILGYAEEEVLGKKWIDHFIPAAYRSRVASALEKIVAGQVEKMEYGENPIINSSGEERLIAWHNTVIRDADGKIIGTLSSGEDITERKIAERALIQSRKDLADFVENAAVALHWAGPDGTIFWANQVELDMLGYARQEYLGHSLAEFFLDPGEGAQVFQRLRNNETLQNYETMLRCKDGSVKYVSINANVLWEDGRFIHTRCFTRDITKRRIAEMKLEHTRTQLEIEKVKLEEVLSIEEGLNTTLNLNKLVDFIVEKTVRVLEAEKCSLMLIDDDRKELCIKGCAGLDTDVIVNSRIKVGDPIAGIVARDGVPLLVTDIETDQRFARPNRPSYRSKSFLCAPIKVDNNLMGVITVSDKRGSPMLNGAAATPVSVFGPLADQGSVMVEQAGDSVFSELDLKILCMITRQVGVAIETAKLYKELNYLTITDPLTNMYNYRHFAKSLDHEIKRLRRFPGSLCLMMLDVDNFKGYNDTFGHLEGDILLKDLGRTLNENLRDIDVACRYAGDEFVIILPGTEVPQAKIVAEKIRMKLAALPLKRAVTLSIGVAAYLPEMDRFELILRADTALYEAKRQGKNRVCCHG